MLFLSFGSDVSVSEKHMVHYQVPACFVFALVLKIKARTAYVSCSFSLQGKKIRFTSCLTTYTVITVLTASHIVLLSFPLSVF